MHGSAKTLRNKLNTFWTIDFETHVFNLSNEKNYKQLSAKMTKIFQIEIEKEFRYLQAFPNFWPVVPVNVKIYRIHSSFFQAKT